MDDELEALQWLTVEELAAVRQRVIKKLNLLDPSASDFPVRRAVLQHTMDTICHVQDDRQR
ncbi:hypothetical protein [Curtobacterium sp. ISL-83]|uniref:hypothetical protein n=1 Tax=Curtobacterium sp. ISL-83 TaxID=2819145 RepID=UPI001BEBFB5F|nr:hypothetical protein [Curtobacterium sp. ISL-83]MBT2504169.1 hypothetical protein [Curtobacterium sp. ISL-83]